jgi:hypothetical protein
VGSLIGGALAQVTVHALDSHGVLGFGSAIEVLIR